KKNHNESFIRGGQTLAGRDKTAGASQKWEDPVAHLVKVVSCHSGAQGKPGCGSGKSRAAGGRFFHLLPASLGGYNVTCYISSWLHSCIMVCQRCLLCNHVTLQRCN